jgi:hypothetical protein
MNEDPALTLKKRYDNGETISNEQALSLLNKSELIKQLLVTPKRKPVTFVGVRNYLWRLLELSEIPYSYLLGKVQNWINLLVEKTYIDDGFALEGNRDGLLACHNAMITTILIKMKYKDLKKIESGIQWILDYQSVERGQVCSWKGSDLYTRFGGCMKLTPCYYGLVKSMITLTEYRKNYGDFKSLDEKLEQGLVYILKHKVFKRLTSDEPIEDSIILNFYPYTYKSNIAEILSLLKSNGQMEDERCIEAIRLLKSKQKKDGLWSADVSYMKSVWVDFDIPKKPGLWISHIIDDLLNK